MEIIKTLKEEKSSLSKERNRLEGEVVQLESKLKTSNDRVDKLAGRFNLIHGSNENKEKLLGFFLNDFYPYLKKWSNSIRSDKNIEYLEQIIKEKESEEERREELYDDINPKLIKNLDNNRIKIGVTNNLNRRLRTIKYNTGCNLEVLYKSPILNNAYEIERKLHNEFFELRYNGEWYEPRINVDRIVEKILELS